MGAGNGLQVGALSLLFSLRFLRVLVEAWRVWPAQMGSGEAREELRGETIRQTGRSVTTDRN